MKDCDCGSFSGFWFLDAHSVFALFAGAIFSQKQRAGGNKAARRILVGVNYCFGCSLFRPYSVGMSITPEIVVSKIKVTNAVVKLTFYGIPCV